MDKLIDSFRTHPAAVGESYLEHMGVASSFGFALMRAGLACFIHAIFPFLFTSTARTAIADLHQRIVTHRDRRSHSQLTH